MHKGFLTAKRSVETQLRLEPKPAIMGAQQDVQTAKSIEDSPALKTRKDFPTVKQFVETR